MSAARQDWHYTWACGRCQAQSPGRPGGGMPIGWGAVEIHQYRQDVGSAYRRDDPRRVLCGSCLDAIRSAVVGVLS